MPGDTVTENEVKAACIDWLRLHGWLVLRINSGAVVGEYRGRRRFVAFVKWFVLGQAPQASGVFDLIAIKPGWLPVAIDTKRPGRRGDVSEAQRRFREAWEAHGAMALVVDDVGQLKALY